MNIFVKQPFLIGDVGTNFYDLAEKENISYIDAAKRMIYEAKQCGLDAVKFQSYNSETLMSHTAEDYGILSKEEINSKFELLLKYNLFDKKDYKLLADYCREVGIIFLSSPLDFDSVDYLDEMMDYYMISSSDLTNIPFIKYVATKKKPIILSTGASTLMEVKRAVSAIEEVSSVNIGIMHSVLSFPTAYEDANLLMIKDLAEHFEDCNIGYSDHTIADENMFVLTTALNYGAIILEKHFTLDKSLPGEDNIHSMDPDDVLKFKENLSFLSKINGYKNKQPLICESLTKKEDRKSLVAARNIKRGDLIKEEDIVFKKPGIGICPADINQVIGKRVIEDICEDTIISFKMLSDDI